MSNAVSSPKIIDDIVGIEELEEEQDSEIFIGDDQFIYWKIKERELIKLWFLEPIFNKNKKVSDPTGLLNSQMPKLTYSQFQRVKNLALIRYFQILRVALYIIVLLNMQ